MWASIALLLTCIQIYLAVGFHMMKDHLDLTVRKVESLNKRMIYLEKGHGIYYYFSKEDEALVVCEQDEGCQPL